MRRYVGVIDLYFRVFNCFGWMRERERGSIFFCIESEQNSVRLAKEIE